MELEFPHSSVFLRNKNLHDFPRHARGAIVWLPFPTGAIIAVVICQTGPKGLVQQVYPLQGAGTQVCINMQMHGYFLEQLLGVPPLPLSTYRSKMLDPDTGKVVPLQDKFGYLKMSTKGPDIAVVPPTSSPIGEVKEWLKKDPWVASDPGFNSYKAINRKEIAVVYVFLNDQGKAAMKTVEEKGLISVPFGGPITKGNGGTNK
jgi:hypothetical protein